MNVIEKIEEIIREMSVVFEEEDVNVEKVKKMM